MTSLAANPETRLTATGVAELLATPRAVRAVGLLGVVAAVGGGALVATSDHLVDPVAYGLQIAVVVAGTVGVALFWAANRPGNVLAPLLLAYAAAIAGVSLQGASNPLLHSIGVLFDNAAFFLGYYVVFAFPVGRFVGLLEKALLAGAAWITLTSSLPFVLFSPVVSGAAPLAKCSANCPSNPLMIADRPDLAGGFGTTGEYLDALFAAAVVACLCYRLAQASRPRRRAALPVYVPALLVTVPFAVFHAANAGIFGLSASSVDTIGWFLTAGRTLLTFGFFFAIVQAMLFAGVVLKKILSRLGREENAAHLRGLVADALDDPSLELAFDYGSNRFVDSRGQPFRPADVRAGGSLTALERHGHTVALIAHDDVLDSDPELVEAAGRALLLALDSGRLESELQSKIDELRISRTRIVAAGEAERRRIERDLHDGAQQRLMAIQIKLALLRDGVDDPELATALDEIGDDASAAIDDLRGLAHGIYPSALRERGLAAGLRSLAMSASVRVDVVDAGVGRCSPAVETAVYFCALEAIQNATKHAGAGARVTVTLNRRADDVEFSVVDDGAGFVPGRRTDGIGLTSMRDRIGAVGGTVEVTSAPGRGTSVTGRAPQAGWIA
jgi:signal transduction histidine kinase